MAKPKYRIEAEECVADFFALMERIDRLNPRASQELSAVIHDICTHTMYGDPEAPPLDMEWSLRHEAVATILYEQLTGRPVREPAR